MEVGQGLVGDDGGFGGGGVVSASGAAEGQWMKGEKGGGGGSGDSAATWLKMVQGKIHEIILSARTRISLSEEKICVVVENRNSSRNHETGE